MVFYVRRVAVWCILLAAAALPPPFSPLQAQALPTHTVLPGDTWDALAWRYGFDAAALQATSPYPNPLRQPIIGTTLTLPGQPPLNRPGQMSRTRGSVLNLALQSGQNVYQLARDNGLADPVLPTFYHPLFAAGGNSRPVICRWG